MCDLDPFLQIGGSLSSLEPFDECEGVRVGVGVLFGGWLAVDCVIEAVGIVGGYLVAGQIEVRSGLHAISWWDGII